MVVDVAALIDFKAIRTIIFAVDNVCAMQLRRRHCSTHDTTHLDCTVDGIGHSNQLASATQHTNNMY